MAKAEKDGEYRINGNYFFIRKGDELPDDTELVEAPAKRAKPAAPENKAKAAAPETK
jgi:hypothetical protein